MLKVGITGGIGSGKTTVCRIFEVLGVPIYYADLEAKNLLNNDLSVKENVVAEFGKNILDNTGNIIRPNLAAIVFNNKEKLEILNNIVHPAVALHMESWISLHQNNPYILEEAAILFESGAYKKMDRIITVISPMDLRIRRTMQRDNVSEENVKQRIDNQWSDEEKIKKSQFVIYNDDTHLIIPQIIEIHQQLLQQAKHS